jgi:PAS domain S-box-containing protein
MVVRNDLTSDVGVAVVAMDHTLQWVNDAFARIVGYLPADLSGRTFESITHADDLDLDQHLADRLFKGKIDKYEMEKRYIHRNGEAVPIHLSVVLVRDRFGSILYALSTVEKIAEPSIFRVQASAPLTPRELEMDRIRRAVIGG